MNCEDFLKMEEYEKAEYAAKLLHVCTSDNALFKSGEELIKLGERKGLLDKVKIGREVNQSLNTDTNAEINQ